jgi:hypothetical protein
MALTARLSPRRPRCQHCARNIRQLADGRWIDSDGFWICFTQTPSWDAPQDYFIHHTPLPLI